MAVLKYYDGDSWEPVASALVGPTGATGVTGPTGATGATGASGLTLINTTSFSGVTSVSLAASTFTSTYDNYLIVYTFVASASNEGVDARLRVGGADNSTANSYIRQRNFISNTTSDNNTATGNLWNFGRTRDNIIVYEVNLFDPFLESATAMATRSGSGDFIFDTRGRHTASTSFDSLSLLIGSGTITGKYSVYGYSK